MRGLEVGERRRGEKGVRADKGSNEGRRRKERREDTDAEDKKGNHRREMKADARICRREEKEKRELNKTKRQSGRNRDSCETQGDELPGKRRKEGK